MQAGLIRLYCSTVSALLLATGVAKLVSAFGLSDILYVYDPLLGITYNKLFLILGSLEIGAAIFLLLPFAGLGVKLGVILALSSQFLLYRLFLVISGHGGHCPCLGTLTDSLPISESTADKLMLGIIGYMILPSIYFLFFSSYSKTPSPNTHVVEP